MSFFGSLSFQTFFNSFNHRLSSYPTRRVDLKMSTTNGAIEDMAPDEAWELIKRYALTRQHTSVRDIKAVKEVDLRGKDPLLVKVAHELALFSKKMESFNVQPQPQQLAMVAANRDRIGI
ncbi:Transposon Ty3-G Gag-Pol polyprotein [Senna tora]|uniref:Transposon Ty3-G Gag-Pol polyprotein n=1 Tax=Senna tora TaxID=362788 RepID=A0A835CA24_9FABA|nr:Transposon Ty3-G Gag-Pol polyprotein [Senna tora]